MAPSRDHGRGTAIIDRRFRGVGRIKKASGTNDSATFKLLNGMLDSLYASGRLDLLEAVRDWLPPLELWDRYRRGELHLLPSPETMRPLWKRDAQGRDAGAVAQWMTEHPVSRWHEAGRRSQMAQLRKVAKAGATVGDLPATVRAYRTACVAARTHRAFNLARAAAQAFVRDTLGKQHRLYAEVGAAAVLPIKRATGRAMEVADARALAEALGPTHGAAWWAMCVTGMGPGEYWGRWRVKADRIHVEGTKRDGRVRDVPLVERPTPPRTQEGAFRVALRAATSGARRPYDARRSYAHWMELAGVPRTRRKLYMGQGVRDVLDLYERHEITTFLAEDATRLRALLGAGPGTDGGLRLVTGDA